MICGGGGGQKDKKYPGSSGTRPNGDESLPFVLFHPRGEKKMHCMGRCGLGEIVFYIVYAIR
jgi:hypothetical protein